MKATPRSAGLFLASLLLFLFSWLFDSLPALFLAGTAAGLLLLCAARFTLSIRVAGATLHVSRTAAPFILKQGGLVAVTSRVILALPPGLSARVSDIPPPGAPVVKGSPHSPLLSAGTHEIELSYAISCLSSGQLSFWGVDLTLCNGLFSLTLPFRGKDFKGPTLCVDPVGRYRSSTGPGVFGEREVESRQVFRGYGIRSFREYLPGDDTRSIDWKLSAKHGKLYIREYAGLAGKSPLLVVDLPDGAVSCPENLRDAVIGAALDVSREMCRSPRGCSLMVISGANLLSYLPDERSFARVEKVLREFHSPRRVIQCYRTLDPAIAESFRQRIEGEGEGDTFSLGLREIYSRFIPAIEPLPFEVQCARALSRRSDVVLHVLTTGTGDPSHLVLLGLQARRRGIEAYLGIPETAGTASLAGRLTGMGYSGVKVIG
ncbi:MAG: DUF58 domain-containing protein [Methanolinea sp.]|nr:DUF58 domain-containing protein [Methanolinea sp.]